MIDLINQNKLQYIICLDIELLTLNKCLMNQGICC